MLKRTPLYDEHVSLGAKIVPFAGWEMPLYYKNIILEHEAVRNSVGIFDIGHMGVVDISGIDALAFVQFVATNDVSTLKENECHYSILCNDAGGVIDDILVYRLAGTFRFVVNASNADPVLSHLASAAAAFSSVNIIHRTDLSMVSVQGPHAKKLFPSLADLPKNFSMDWSGFFASRTGYTGEDGFEIVTPLDRTVGVWKRLLGAGVRPCGLGARDTLRIEAGLPLYGHEYSPSINPLEAGYGWAVKLSKANFIGKDSLLNIRDKGAAKKLVGLKLDGKNIPREGFLVKAGGKNIGVITSGTFSPTLKIPVALAYLDPAYAVVGGSVGIEIRDKTISAVVTSKKLI